MITVWRIVPLLFLVSATARSVTLDECLSQALAGSPALEAAVQRAASAEAAIGQARSAWYPQVRVGANYARTDNPPQAFMMVLNQRSLSLDGDFNQPDDTENLRLSALAMWRLWDSGRRSMDNRMAALAAKAQKSLLAAAHSDLAHQVTRAYYGVLQASAFVAVQDESVRTIEESLRVAGERFAAGSAVKTDVLNLEVRLAEANEERIRARNAHQLAIAALNTAIGSEAVQATDTLAAPVTLPDLPGAPSDQAIDQRGELQAARAMTQVREAGWKKAGREYGPTLNAFGSYDWDSDVSSDFENSYFAGIAAELDVFDGFRRPSGTRSARAEYLATRADEQRVRDQLALDLRQAVLQVTEARERLDVAEKSVASAEEALRITRERYEQGAADITELLTAQVGLTATNTRRVGARYDYLIALSNRRRAEGAPPSIETTPTGD
jgi:outer membrane protein